jgi:hypothetical protein
LAAAPSNGKLFQSHPGTPHFFGKKPAPFEKVNHDVPYSKYGHLEDTRPGKHRNNLRHRKYGPLKIIEIVDLL